MEFEMNLPVPYKFTDKLYNGSIIKLPDECVSCRIKCSNGTSTAIEECSYGFNFITISDNLSIIGFIVNDIQGNNHKYRNRMYKKYPSNILKKKNIEYLIETISNSVFNLNSLVEEEKQKIIDEYMHQNQFHKDFLKQFQSTITKNLSFVHDYKQINTQISQNINIIIETKYSGASIDEKVDNSSNEEKAIYFASKLLSEKLLISRYLIDSEIFYNRNTERVFRFHGLVTKYLRIYKQLFSIKNIYPTLTGSSFSNIKYNPDLIGIIVQTLIDNSQKYSPKNSSVEFCIIEENGHINFKVTSFGPVVHDNEISKIFDAFYRGKEAEKEQEEGTGYGLYVSQMIARKHLNSNITFRQDKQKNIDNKYVSTIFEINIVINTENNFAQHNRK